jgi:hypothetical protein
MSESPREESAVDRTQRVAARLKEIYRKSILPVEKRYRYDYFFESPLLSDVEFDGAYKFFSQWQSTSRIGAFLLFSRFTLSKPLHGRSQASGAPSGTIFCRKNVIHSLSTRKRLSWSENWSRAHVSTDHCDGFWFSIFRIGTN